MSVNTLSFIKNTELEDYPVEEVSLSSVEDVATLVDVYMGVIESGVQRRVIGVRSIGDSYVFVCGEKETIEPFNPLQYVEKCYQGEETLTFLNLRLLCPEELSRGLYQVSGVSNTDEFPEEDEEDEIPTGYFDEEDNEELKKLAGKVKEEPKLLIVASGVRVPIDETGVVFGRSEKKVDFSIHNPLMSRVHAKVYRKDGKYYVHDFESVNGTKIDGLKVKPENDREIIPGSTLFMADEEFKLV